MVAQTPQQHRWIHEDNAPKIIPFPTQNPIAPYSTEAEEAVLGSVIANPDMLAKIDFLQSTDFYLIRHANIWRAIEKCEADPDVAHIDYLVLARVLEENGKLEDTGGIPYLIKLVNDTPTSAHAETYARLIQRAAMRRRMMEASHHIFTIAMDESLSLPDAIAKANQLLFEATDQRLEDNVTDMQTVASAYLDTFMQPIEDLHGIGLPIGLRDFDQRYGGLHKREQVIVVAPSGVGKTTLALTIAANVARPNYTHVTIFAQEQKKDELFRKLLSMETGLATNRLKNRRDLTEQENHLVVEAIGRLSKWRINIVDDMAGITPLQFKRRIRKLQTQYPVDLVIVDSLWFMHSDNPNVDEKTKYNDIGGAMAEIARELNIRLLMTHQYNRNQSHRARKRPELTDLFGGGDKDAYLVLGLYRPDAGDTRTELVTLKHRDGVGVGESTLLSFSVKHNRYVDYGVKL